MKKTILSVLILCFSLCLTMLAFSACNSDSDGKATTTTTTQPPENPPEPPEQGAVSTQDFGNYTLVFVSNGDGTCYVSEICIDQHNTEWFVLTIPERTQEGDTVVQIKEQTLSPHAIPLILSDLDFVEKLKTPLQLAVEANLIDSFSYEKAIHMFKKISLNNIVLENEKSDILEQYPIASLTDFYVLKPDTSNEMLIWLQNRFDLADIAPEMSMQAIQNLKTISKDHSDVLDSLLIYEPVPTAYYVTEIVLPTTLTACDWSVFRNCANLENIALPNCISTIPSDAFPYSKNIESIVISENVTSIDNEVFRSFENLKSVSFSKNSKLTTIGDRAFDGCRSLVEITLPDSVMSIGNYAFNGCTKLEKITFSDSLARIGNYAFCGCNKLVEISIPDSVVSMGELPFLRCKNIVQIESGVHYVGKWVVGCDLNVTSINLRADTVGIVSVAFINCTELTSITIPATVRSIGYGIFFGCDNLSSVTIDENNTVYRSEGVCIIETISGTLIEGGQSTDIPQNITSIAPNAFFANYKLTHITISDSVTSIGAWAFNQCSNLKSITISNSVVSIDNDAFYACRQLVDIYYNGTEEEWIAVAERLNLSENVTVHFAK